MKKKTFISIIIFLTVSLAALFVSAFAWFIMPGTYSPSFSAQVVRSYFDNSSGNSAGTENNPFIITKPVHLYNLSYLQNKGVFSDKTYYFQLGKQKSMIDSTSTDTTYYVYSSNLSDETSNDDLTSTNIDMTQYNSGIIQPIGYSSATSFISVFKGNDISISNLTVQPTETMNNIGMFGYIGDNSSIKNFNLDNLIINTPVITSTSTDTVGLVVGYMDGTTSSSIELEGIGVKDSTINGKRKAASLFSLVGGGSEASMTAIQNGYNSISGDTGVMYGDEMFASLQAGNAPFQDNFTHNGGAYYNKAYAWVGSDETSFGIFNLGTNKTANQAGFGSYFSTTTADYFDFSSEFQNEFNSPTIDVTKKNTSAIIEGSYSSSTSKKTSFTLGEGSTISKKFVDSSNVEISRVTYALAFPGKAQYNLTMSGIDYANNNKTATIYQNALFFTITKETGGYINFVCSVPSDKTSSNRNLGIWKMDSNGTTSKDGSFYSNYPNYFYFVITESGATKQGNITCAFSFLLPKGTYLISSSQNGLYFNYVSVSGAGGNTGDVTILPASL